MFKSSVEVLSISEYDLIADRVLTGAVELK
jgi:hypothetical protein